MAQRTAVAEALERAGYDGSASAYIDIQKAAGKLAYDHAALARWIEQQIDSGGLSRRAVTALLAKFVLADVRGDALRQKIGDGSDQLSISVLSHHIDRIPAPSPNSFDGGARDAVPPQAGDRRPVPPPSNTPSSGDDQDMASLREQTTSAFPTPDEPHCDGGTTWARPSRSEASRGFPPPSQLNTPAPPRPPISDHVSDVRRRAALSVVSSAANSVLSTLRMSDGRKLGSVRIRELKHYQRESTVIAQVCGRLWERNAVSPDKFVHEVETDDSVSTLMAELQKEAQTCRA